jgi:hypothetical protein
MVRRYRETFIRDKNFEIEARGNGHCSERGQVSQRTIEASSKFTG